MGSPTRCQWPRCSDNGWYSIGAFAAEIGLRSTNAAGGCKASTDDGPDGPHWSDSASAPKTASVVTLARMPCVLAGRPMQFQWKMM